MSRHNRISSETSLWYRGAAVAVGLGALVFSCAVRVNANSDGEGNHFKIKGAVVSTSEHEINTRIISVEEAEGQALGMFATGKTVTVYDEFHQADLMDCEWRDVGRLTDVEGQPIEEDQLHVGSFVELEGRVRDNADKCGKRVELSPRPVYDQGTQIPG